MLRITEYGVFSEVDAPYRVWQPESSCTVVSGNYGHNARLNFLQISCKKRFAFAAAYGKLLLFPIGNFDLK